MKTARLFASTAMLALGVFLWKGFVATGDGEGCKSADIKSPATLTAPTTASATAQPVPAAVPLSSVAHTPAVAAVQPSAPLASATRALYSPAGSVLKEAAQPAAPGSVIVMKPMPRRSLARDADTSSSPDETRATTTADSALAPGSAQARYRARAARRTQHPVQAAKAKPSQHRHAATFEHPLGVR
jgi:hypothetical protein